MKTLTIKAYNSQQTRKWNKDWDMAVKSGRDWGMMPQLAMYIFEKNYGYVAFDEKKACWAKTKKEAIKLFNNK